MVATYLPPPLMIGTGGRTEALGNVHPAVGAPSVDASRQPLVSCSAAPPHSPAGAASTGRVECECAQCSASSGRSSSTGTHGVLAELAISPVKLSDPPT